MFIWWSCTSASKHSSSKQQLHVKKAPVILASAIRASYAVHRTGADTGFFQGVAKRLVLGKIARVRAKTFVAPLWNNLCFCEFACEARKIFWLPPWKKIYGGQSQIFVVDKKSTFNVILWWQLFSQIVPPPLAPPGPSLRAAVGKGGTCIRPDIVHRNIRFI